MSYMVCITDRHGTEGFEFFLHPENAEYGCRFKMEEVRLGAIVLWSEGISRSQAFVALVCATDSDREAIDSGTQKGW